MSQENACTAATGEHGRIRSLLLAFPLASMNRRPPSSPSPSPPSRAGRRPLAPGPADRAEAEDAPAGVRLSKVMADRGMCSRREADALIEKGWVFVDGQRVAELGTRIRPDAQINLAPEARA